MNISLHAVFCHYNEQIEAVRTSGQRLEAIDAIILYIYYCSQLLKSSQAITTLHSFNDKIES